MEPLIENVEERQELSLRILGALAGLPVDHFIGPHLGSPVHERQHKVLFGREVSIQGRFRDTCLRHDFIDTNVTYPATREQLLAGVDEPLAGAGRVIGRHSKLSSAAVEPLV